MNKKRNQILGMALVSMMLFTGCGTSLHELTASEEDMIVHYAASVVAKHNHMRCDGIVPVTESDEEITQETVQEETTQEETTQEEIENSTQEEQIQMPENSSEEGSNTAAQISIAEAIGHANDLQIEYKGYDVRASYEGTSYFSLQAPEGYSYAILNFDILNNSDSAVEIDNLSQSQSFFMKVGGKDIEAEITIALNDFSSYQGTIEPQETVQTVLLFKIPQDLESQMDGFSLYSRNDGKTYMIKL